MKSIKKYFINYIILSICILTVSCNDWLLEGSPASSGVEEYFMNGAQACINNITGDYSPLQWEYNKTYYPDWFIGDVCSDDALKGGGSREDMSSVLQLENFMTIPENDVLLDYYRTQYMGIARCNNSIKYIADAPLDTALTVRLRNRLLGEAHFLRAMYYFKLVRVFGGTALVTQPILVESEWRQPRASMADIYAQIIRDLESANATLWRKEDYADEEMGHATKGAAQAMLLKVNLYRAGWTEAGFMQGNAADYYTQAKLYGDSLINHQDKSGAYSLVSNYWDNFTIAGENGAESVFEVQYSEDPQGDYGNGNGFTRGTFTMIMTRSKSEKISQSPVGWGFNKPTQNLFDEYETSDPRRDLTVWNPGEALMTNPAVEIYMGNPYLSTKYAMYTDGPAGGLYELTHATRGPINIKLIRFSDVLLMYAEACAATGDLAKATAALNSVRERARGGNAAILPDFPYGSYTNSAADLTKAIRHERRVELAMESHRWYDLCRWGVVGDVMEHYRTTAGMESTEAQADMKPFEKGKHELFPIPREEMNLTGYTQADQNPGY
ncbi:MAG: RagB/SusD family nutrient uptake outer membrane protein [Prevotellaceae bacterium]|nr:RagB/SusD family nutrient uptake outer membrane protein [Prevotellaceae bacterium]